MSREGVVSGSLRCVPFMLLRHIVKANIIASRSTGFSSAASVTLQIQNMKRLINDVLL